MTDVTDEMMEAAHRAYQQAGYEFAGTAELLAAVSAALAAAPTAEVICPDCARFRRIHGNDVLSAPDPDCSGCRGSGLRMALLLGPTVEDGR